MNINFQRVIKKMRALDFDVVIDCELFTRISSIFSSLFGAKIRVGFEAHTCRKACIAARSSFSLLV